MLLAQASNSSGDVAVVLVYFGMLAIDLCAIAYLASNKASTGLIVFCIVSLFFCPLVPVIAAIIYAISDSKDDSN